jgi:hypothetical protein
MKKAFVFFLILGILSFSQANAEDEKPRGGNSLKVEETVDMGNGVGIVRFDNNASPNTPPCAARNPKHIAVNLNQPGGKQLFEAFKEAQKDDTRLNVRGLGVCRTVQGVETLMNIDNDINFIKNGVSIKKPIGVGELLEIEEIVEYGRAALVRFDGPVSTNTPGCAVMNPRHIAINTIQSGGRQILEALKDSKKRKSPVNVMGMGTCKMVQGVEDLLNVLTY